jgi:hypothetical protein
MNTTKLVTIPLDMPKMNGIQNACSQYRYEETPNSCTERVYAVLGQLSEETFRQNIQEQKQNNRGRQYAEIEGYNTNSIGMNTTLLLSNPNEAFDSLPPGTCCAAHLLHKDGRGGHSVVFTKDTNGQTSILDPSLGLATTTPESQNVYLNQYGQGYFPTISDNSSGKSKSFTPVARGGKKKRTRKIRKTRKYLKRYI